MGAPKHLRLWKYFKDYNIGLSIVRLLIKGDSKNLQRKVLEVTCFWNLFLRGEEKASFGVICLPPENISRTRTAQNNGFIMQHCLAVTELCWKKKVKIMIWRQQILPFWLLQNASLCSGSVRMKIAGQLENSKQSLSATEQWVKSKKKQTNKLDSFAKHWFKGAFFRYWSLFFQ